MLLPSFNFPPNIVCKECDSKDFFWHCAIGGEYGSLATCRACKTPVEIKDDQEQAARFCECNVEVE